MDGTERVARMLAALTPRSPRVERIATATGNRLTVEDVIHMLSFVEAEEARLLLRIVYVGQSSFFPALAGLLAGKDGIVYRMGKRYRWPLRQGFWPGLLKRLGEIAVLEAIRDPLCHVCQGRGWVLVEAETRPHREPCKTCFETGLGSMSHTKRAGLANIKTDTWRRHWIGPYGEVRKAVMALESDGLYQMARSGR